MDSASRLGLSEEQLKFNSNLLETQKKIADEYFDTLSPLQRIANLSDNFGKRINGHLFDSNSFLDYLKSQEGRYSQESLWPSVKWAEKWRRDGAVLQDYTIEKTIDWLAGLGVNIDDVLAGLADYGPKFVVVSRHGELYNPKNIVYGRDSEMKPEDIIHLSEIGVEQMKAVAKTLNSRNFKPNLIITSPSIRAIESGNQLREGLKVASAGSSTSDDLDDTYAPGPYSEGLTMDEWQQLKGDAYDETRWGKYNHEKPDKIIERINRAFWSIVDKLKVGQTGLLVSHGDPIAWWINYQVVDQLPEPAKLRDAIYPNKGEAIIAIIDPAGNFFCHYILTDSNLIAGTSF